MTEKDTLVKLHETVAALNMMADAANKQLKAAEVVLNQMNIGIEVMLEEPIMPGLQMAYAKDDEGSWHIVAVFEDELKRPFKMSMLNVARLVRIHAARKVPLLTAALLHAAEEQLAKATAP